MSMRGGLPHEPGYTTIQHTDAAGRRHPVHVAGDGPPVVIIHELAGVSPMLLEFARRVRERGFATHLPVLIERRGGPARLLVAAIQVCVSAEFTKLARGKTSPIVGWLRSYGTSIHLETGNEIGVVGMCLTGGFALAMAVDPHVAASVTGHPTLPLGIGTARQRDLGIDSADLAALKRRSDLSVKGVRFSCDLIAPRRRFDRMQEEFGDRFDRTDVASGPGSRLGFSRWEHSLLNNRRLQPGNPTKDAARAELERVVDEVLDFLELRLRPGSRGGPPKGH
jgi:dienelactone hydrolase